ncbi:MAG TPA: hypothetical protein VF711_01830, partial [Acidimicrobiales bacterium]
AVRRLAPPALRVFGGTTANYWDWRGGWFVPDVELPRDLASLPRMNVSLDKWKALLTAAGASPVFDLNIVTSTLEDQLAMLKAAEDLGLPVKRVELGNELYQSAGPVVDRFPTPSDYGREAARWIDAIKARYPEAKVAVVGALARQGSRPTERKTSWNRGVRETVGSVDGITLHLYFGAGIEGEGKIGEATATGSSADKGSGTATASEKAAAQAVVTATRKRLDEFRNVDLAALPPGAKAWVSEFNLFDRDSFVPGTWLHGLVVAQIAMALSNEPRVDLALMHALVGNPVFAAVFGRSPDSSSASVEGPSDEQGPGFRAGSRHGTSFADTAAGTAIGRFFTAARGASTAQPLAFAGATSELTGVAYETPTGRKLVLANLGPQERAVDFESLAPGAPFTTESARPLTFVGGPSDVEQRSATAQRPVVLPAYSLTLVG